ncbi:MAG TPA: UGSC family (seleno)protein [Gammaproteobacteria bacterium]
MSVHTNVFARLVNSVTRAAGMPTARQAYVPQPIVDQSAAQLRAYIEGVDPVSKRSFAQELIDGLSGPLTDEDHKGTSFERSTPRLLEPDTEDNLRRQFEENRWTDNLPIILPTEERVAKMLEGTSHAPDEVVGTIAPTHFREAWEFTVEKVAVNAVMAGARPEYLPVILALLASGQTARSSSTNSFATISVINGPIRDEIGMDDGIGALGPYNHANATIGRAYSLASINLQGGSVPGDTYMGSLGNWYNYSSVFPEAEDRSPWQPLHVQHGFEADASVATVFFGGWYTLAGYGPRQSWQEKLQKAFAAAEPYLPPILVMDPIVARGFVELGYDSKEKLIEWCARNARLSAREYWDNQWTQSVLKARGVAGIEPYASRLAADPEDLIEMYTEDEIKIVVAGGETQGAWKIFGGVHRPGYSSPIDPWR